MHIKVVLSAADVIAPENRTPECIWLDMGVANMAEEICLPSESSCVSTLNPLASEVGPVRLSRDPMNMGLVSNQVKRVE